MKKLTKKNLIVTADDFGISQGVNNSIEQAHRDGLLTHASLLVNGEYFDEAIDIAKNNNNLNIGLHFNLTFGAPVQVSQLAGKDGNFYRNFFSYLFTLFFSKSLRSYIRQELIAQIQKIQNAGIIISHIDGHHHVHMIPAIYDIVLSVAKEYKINRVRIINEYFYPSFKIAPNKISLFFKGNIIKWLIFRILYKINKKMIKNTDSYFFSIMHSCAISPEIISEFELPDSYDKCEVMLHPGNPVLDKNCYHLEADHLSSDFRKKELQTSICLKSIS